MEVVVDANGNDKKFPNIALVSFNPNSYIFIVMFAISKPLANPMLTLQFFPCPFPPLVFFSPPCAPRGLEKGGGNRKRGGKVDLLVVTLPSSSSSVGGGDTKLAAEKRRGEGKGKGA